ncbi:MAG: hypothetical protein JSV76_00725 [Candidatus Bathyarchaeota archaeon]|nr:MAG: hypothetical protein JSV76_00725 [Candidatus Bathyarchaeota archaeon]
MHERILTQREKDAIRVYLETGQSSGFVYVLRHRTKKFLPILKAEIELLEQFVNIERTHKRGDE